MTSSYFDDAINSDNPELYLNFLIKNYRACRIADNYICICSNDYECSDDCLLKSHDCKNNININTIYNAIKSKHISFLTVIELINIIESGYYFYINNYDKLLEVSFESDKLELCSYFKKWNKYSLAMIKFEKSNIINRKTYKKICKEENAPLYQINYIQKRPVLTLKKIANINELINNLQKYTLQYRYYNFKDKSNIYDKISVIKQIQLNQLSLLKSKKKNIIDYTKMIENDLIQIELYNTKYKQIISLLKSYIVFEDLEEPYIDLKTKASLLNN
jgi:hypothetical protein